MPAEPWPPPSLLARASLLRVLWRLQGPKRVVCAALHRHPAGTELRVFFEPEGPDDWLETQFERFDVWKLEERAEALRTLLTEKGCTPLQVDDP